MIEDNKKAQFYRSSKNFNPFLLTFLSVISLGFFLVHWIYCTNLKLENIDEDAPDSKRAGVILFFLPASWTIIITILSNLTNSFSSFFLTAKVFGWILLSFVALKYLFDFCISFGQATNTKPYLWYYLIYLGYLSLILLIFGFYYTLPMLLFPIMTLSAMQFILNKRTKEVELEENRTYFNTVGRIQ